MSAKKKIPTDGSYFIVGWKGLTEATGLAKSTLKKLERQGLLYPINVHGAYGKPLFARSEIEQLVWLLQRRAQHERVAELEAEQRALRSELRDLYQRLSDAGVEYG